MTSDQVQAMTVDTLIEQFHLDIDGHKWSTEDIWNVVVAASAQGQAIESAADQLKDAPDPSTVRLYLRTEVNGTTLEALEQAGNDAVVAHLPPGIRGKRHQVAIDLTLIPYHGEAGRDPKEIRRAKAKSGTTHFHCYATAYVIKKHKRVTLAFTYVQAKETLIQVLERLFARLSALEVGLKRLYLDQQFYTVAVINYFKSRYPHLEVIVPVIIRGKQGGTRALLKGRKSYRTIYTMRSRQDGEASFAVGVVCKYSQGRYGRHGVDWFVYVVLGPIRTELHHIYEAYRRRFGIESTYRLMNRVRARTSSRSAGLRLVYVGVALSLANIWVYLKWAYVSVPRRGGRLVQAKRFPLTMFKQFLLEEIKAIYGAVRSISLPAAPCATTNA
ncbi:MAG: ISH3 family transposase [Anaerolineae bacterium]